LKLNAKSPAVEAGPFVGFRDRAYFGGDSVFDAEPAGPVVVFGAIDGSPLAPPFAVIPELPPELAPVVPVGRVAAPLPLFAPILSDFCSVEFLPAGLGVWA
jgi:hypothetical protein